MFIYVRECVHIEGDEQKGAGTKEDRRRGVYVTLLIQINDYTHV